MHMSDTKEIKAAPPDVWAAILDPDVLRACIPGCTEVTGNRDDGFEATVTQKVGPVKATFKGAVTLSNITEGRSVTLSGEGKGGAAGFAKGGAVVTLEPIPSGTRLSYQVEASVGGKLAQLGSRIIDGFAKKMADDFFTRFQQAVEGPADPETGTEAVSDEEMATTDETKQKGWFKRLIS